MELYLISGKARHGKDTSADIIEKLCEKRGLKTCKLHLSYPLRTYSRDFFGWDEQEETKPRELMQKLGTEIIRKKLGKELFFIDRITEDIEILSNFYDVFLISDVRFPIEIDTLKKRFPKAKTINVFRPNFDSIELTEEQKKHLTEIALDDYDNYDYKIINESLEKLEEDLEQIVRNEEINYEENE